MAVVLYGTAGPPQFAGDSCEYLQMTESLANHASAEPRAEDVRALAGPCPWLRAYRDEPGAPAHIGPYSRARNGEYYSYHFWGYSLAAVPAELARRALGGRASTASSATNAVLLIVALACIAWLSPLPRARRTALLALTAASPVLWFLRWPHPEVFSYALVTIGLVLVDRGRYAWAAVAIAIASWQAPPLLVVLAWSLTQAARRGWRSLILAAAPAGVVAVVPTAFSLWAFGVPSMLAGRGSSTTQVSVRRILELALDPNIGMWMYVPVTLTLFVAAAVWGLLVRRTVSPAGQLLAVLVTMMALASTTYNWNHGTEGPSRYVVWMLPIVFHGVASIPTSSARAWSAAHGPALAACLVTQIGVLAALGGMAPRFTYLEHSPLARLVLGRVPQLYNPSPEIFLERTRHEEMPSSFGVFFWRGRCRKALVTVRDLRLLEAACGALPEQAKWRRQTDPPDDLGYVDFPKGTPRVSDAGVRAAMTPSSLAAWLALTHVPCGEPHPTPCDVVTLDLSAHRVSLGDRVRAVVRARPDALVAGADLYLGVTLPNGQRFVRRSPGFLEISATRHGLSRADRTGTLGAAGRASTIPLFDVVIGPGFVAGSYEVFAVVARPATPAQTDVALPDLLAWAVETIVVNAESALGGQRGP